MNWINHLYVFFCYFFDSIADILTKFDTPGRVSSAVSHFVSSQSHWKSRLVAPTNKQDMEMVSCLEELVRLANVVDSIGAIKMDPAAAIDRFQEMCGSEVLSKDSSADENMSAAGWPPKPSANAPESRTAWIDLPLVAA